MTSGSKTSLKRALAISLQNVHDVTVRDVMHENEPKASVNHFTANRAWRKTVRDVMHENEPKASVNQFTEKLELLHLQ